MTRMARLARAIATHPLQAYIATTLAISWSAFLAAGGSGAFTGTDWETDPNYLRAITALVAGPPAAAIVLTLCTTGMQGLRELLGSAVRWRIGVGWYALALLTAPAVELAVLIGLSLFSDEYIPAVATADRKGLLVAAGLAVGLGAGAAAELGWTGFATAQVMPRRGVVATGVILGLAWGAWHVLDLTWISRPTADDLPPGLYLALAVLSSLGTLTAFRILMAWLFAQTHSLLLASLMHGSYVLSTVGVLAPFTEGIPFLIFNGAFAVALWCLVGVIGLATGFEMTDHFEASSA